MRAAGVRHNEHQARLSAWVFPKKKRLIPSKFKPKRKQRSGMIKPQRRAFSRQSPPGAGMLLRHSPVLPDHFLFCCSWQRRERRCFRCHGKTMPVRYCPDIDSPAAFLYQPSFVCEKYCNYSLVVILGMAHNLKRNQNGYT